jgi:hypothetical protein
MWNFLDLFDGRYVGNKMKVIFRKMKLKKKRFNGYIFYKKINQFTLKKLMSIIRIRGNIILIYFRLLMLKVRGMD